MNTSGYSRVQSFVALGAFASSSVTLESEKLNSQASCRGRMSLLMMVWRLLSSSHMVSSSYRVKSSSTLAMTSA